MRQCSAQEVRAPKRCESCESYDLGLARGRQELALERGTPPTTLSRRNGAPTAGWLSKLAPRRSMNTCTSCQFPLMELESFDVAVLPRAGEAGATLFLGDATSLVCDAKSSLRDAESSLGDV